jgi:hypothetical protein
MTEARLTSVTAGNASRPGNGGGTKGSGGGSVDRIINKHTRAGALGFEIRLGWHAVKPVVVYAGNIPQVPVVGDRS